MRIKEANHQRRPRVDAQLGMNAFQVRPNGTGGRPQEQGRLDLVVAQHKALKDLDFASREAQRFGDARPCGLTEEASASGAVTGIGHRGPLLRYHTVNCHFSREPSVKSEIVETLAIRVWRDLGSAVYFGQIFGSLDNRGAAPWRAALCRDPGEYLPDANDRITDPKDLPKPKIVPRSRERPQVLYDKAARLGLGV
jgi:hypothetical protein